MSAPEPKKDVNEVLRLRDHFVQAARQHEARAAQLENEARVARSQAREMERNAQVMHEAYYLMQKESAANQNAIATGQLDEKAIEKMAKRKVVFLIDGSGSMHGEILPNTIAAVEKISDRLAQKGGSVEAIMFGDRTPYFVDLNNKEQLEKVKRGLNCGTDMQCGVDAVAAKLKKNKAAQIVIVSDGDIFDRDWTQPALNSLLDTFPKARVDAVIIYSQQEKRESVPRHLNLRDVYAGHAGYYLESGTRTVAPASNAHKNLPTNMEQMLADLKPADASKMPEIVRVTPSEIEAGIAGIIARSANKSQPALRRPKTPNSAPGK